MKANLRLTWVKIHTYFACFFLPITLLYVATGVLYLFDIKGSHSAEYEYSISLPEGWPKDEEMARKYVLPVIQQHSHGKLPPDFYLEDEWIGWFGYKQEIFLDPTQDIENAKLQVNKHDLWHQLLLIHKGHAGIFFWIMAIMLGTSLVLSMLTGLVLAMSIPKLRTASLWVTLFGMTTLAVAFITGY